VLESVVLKCLEKDPKHRFKTADEVIAALRADRAVEVIGVKKPVALPPREPERPRSRALQMVPAFMMAAAAFVLHVMPQTAPKQAAAAPPPQAAPAPVEVAAAAPAPAPQPTAPAKIQVTLMSTPKGADMYLGDEPLGESPVTVSIPVSSEPIALVARFADGVEVTQTIVPDRPLPTISFDKPKAGTPVARPRPKKVTAPVARPTSTDREGTINPFK
jgi:hypothetical protein